MQIPIRTRATARPPVAHASMARTGLARPRRTFALAAAAAAVSVAMPGAAFAQASGATFPSKPIRVIVGFSPGSNSDSLVRPLAQRLSETVGQQVLVDNRPGASGNIALEMVSRAAPDGHTVFSGPGSSITVNPHIHPKMPIDVLRDLLPIVMAPHVKTGKLRALATTGRERSKALPDLPTLAQAGVADYEYTGFQGLFGSAALPKDVADRMNALVMKVLALPDMCEFYAGQNVDPMVMGVAEFAAKVRVEHDTWGKLIRDAGLKPAG